MILPEPIALPNESPKAFHAFKAYIQLGDNRSLHEVSRKCRKCISLMARWCRKHHWVARLKAMEAEAAAQENERQAMADLRVKEETAKRLSVAKEKVAMQIEFERLRFVQRQIEASTEATQKALAILRQPVGDSAPADAARLFAVAHTIGSSVLNLPGANVNVGGIGAPAAAFTVNLTYDATSLHVDEIKKQFLLEHPDHPQAEVGLAKIAERQAGWMARNGHNGHTDGE